MSFQNTDTSRAATVRAMEQEHALLRKQVLTHQHLTVVTWEGTNDAYVLQHCPQVAGVREEDGILILGLEQLETLRDLVTLAAEARS